MRCIAGLAVALSLGLTVPALAIDCEKAASPSEKTICADPAAKEADAAMSKAFIQLLANDSPSEKSAAVAAQAEWLTSRDGVCSDLKDKKFAACLVEQSARRRAFLAAEPEAGPGAPGRLAPVFRIEKGHKGKAGVTLELLKYPAPATPAERAFNAAVEKLVGALDEPEQDDPAADRYEYDRTLRLAYASPRLVSAHLDGYDDTGGAHPSTFTGDVNVDIEKSREAKFSDILDERGAKAVFAFCLKGVVAEKKERMGADAPLSPEDVKQLAKSVADSTGDLKDWSFGADAATVSYDAYAVGSYAEGAYECVIPYATLKPLAKAEFPLP